MKEWLDSFSNMFVENRTLRMVSLVLGGIILFLSFWFLILGTSRDPQSEEVVTMMEFEQVGEYSFEAYLKPNTLYETDHIGDKIYYYTNLLDTLILNYTYMFETAQMYDNATFTYQAYATVGTPEVWEKQIDLIPPTTVRSPQFSFSVILPVAQIEDIFDIFVQETGVQSGVAPVLITVLVVPEVETAYGVVDHKFEHQLDLQVSSSTIQPGEASGQAVPGALEVLQTVPGPTEGQLRTQTIIGIVTLLLALGIFTALAFVYWEEWRSSTQEMRDFRYAKRRLGGLFVETREIKPVGDNEETIYLTSLKDLVNLADETLRPVLYQIDEEGKINFVILRLGYVRYEYVSKDSLADES